ncbi:hypothetical protein [Parasphingorhabdus cellanae]|uniref:Uncharacterized protein n=1 Tax=Parasphingorhabdus cellanae TaxID=2806553 RepID=A0ABX7T0J8_9SPHN|nr:hypothetical protein [Parasphingorhabdus cellanae]QTD55060.1 hypothetical protein J4G78_12595 [Parasphingorhabdus cellanae]
MTDKQTGNDRSEGIKSREADHPRHTYQTPANVLTDEHLSTEQKRDILRYWKEDVEARLRAEGEGMGQSEPISADKESTLAEEQQLINQALAEIEK